MSATLNKCTRCPLPSGTRCESEIPCIYNKEHTPDAKKYLKPVKSVHPEDYIKALNFDTN